MRKIKSLMLLLGTCFALAACSGMGGGKAASTAADSMSDSTKEMSSKDAKMQTADGKKTVVATTSFLYDMVKQIAGDTVEVQLIIPAGEDPHLYVAKPEDFEKLDNADLVLYHGLHFEGKMVEVLEKIGTSVSEKFPQDQLGQMDEDGEMITDPHFWFDLDLYKMAVERASEGLIALNPTEGANYTKSTQEYLKQLDELDAYNKEQLEKIPKEQRYLITPHDAFNYFSRRYEVTVKAPQGVSTASEVANADIQETIDFIVEHKIKAVFAESTTDPARMEKLREGVLAKGGEVKIVSGHGNELFSDSLAPEGESGDNFIDMYKHNVDLMVKNLSE